MLTDLGVHNSLLSLAFIYYSPLTPPHSLSLSSFFFFLLLSLSLNTTPHYVFMQLSFFLLLRLFGLLYLSSNYSSAIFLLLLLIYSFVCRPLLIVSEFNSRWRLDSFGLVFFFVFCFLFFFVCFFFVFCFFLNSIFNFPFSHLFLFSFYFSLPLSDLPLPQTLYNLSPLLKVWLVITPLSSKLFFFIVFLLSSTFMSCFISILLPLFLTSLLSLFLPLTFYFAFPFFFLHASVKKSFYSYLLPIVLFFVGVFWGFFPQFNLWGCLPPPLPLSPSLLWKRHQKYLIINLSAPNILVHLFPPISKSN